MCYMNCPFENSKGECTKSDSALRREKCPHEMDEEEARDLQDEHDDNLCTKAEEKKLEARYEN